MFINVRLAIPGRCLKKALGGGSLSPRGPSCSVRLSGWSPALLWFMPASKVTREEGNAVSLPLVFVSALTWVMHYTAERRDVVVLPVRNKEEILCK